MPVGSGATTRTPWLSAHGKRWIATLLASLALLAACSSESVGRSGSTARPGPDGRIVVRTDQVLGPFDRRLLGTNVPAWLGGTLAWIESGRPVESGPGGG